MKTAVGQLHVGAGTTIGPLTLFPVWSLSTQTTSFALPNDSNMKVGELPNASVPFLMVENCGPVDLLIPEGTILEGGLQTRIAAHDYLVSVGQTIQIDVRCVEHGRWGGSVREHRTDGRAPNHVVSSLRKTLRPEGYGGSSQAEVWDSVRRIEEHFGQKPSGSLNDIFADEGMSTRKPRTNRAYKERRASEDRIVSEEILQELEDFARKPLAGQCGVIIGIAGEPVSLELYATADLFAEQYVAILRAACLDAVFADWTPTPGWKARSFAQHVSEIKLQSLQQEQRYESVRGLSEDIDIRAIFVRDGEELALRTSALNRKHLVNA